MVFVALLRGINVGGNNKVPMKTLKEVFEKEGMTDVKTFINSGNIIFNSSEDRSNLVSKLEKAIEKEFGFSVKVLLKTFREISEIRKALKNDWVNDANTKCDVMFLWEDVDSKETLKEFQIKDDIDEVKYISGAILWKVDKANVTKSGMLKIVGTPLYKKMTIRNANSLRKIYEIMNEY